MTDPHGGSREDEGWPQHDWVAELRGFFEGLLDAACGGARRLLNAKIGEQGRPLFTVFGKINAVRAGTEDRDACLVERLGEFEWGLPAKLNNHAGQIALGLFLVNDLGDMFLGQRLEVEAIRGVIVG